MKRHNPNHSLGCGKFSVLIPEAHAIGAIGVIRSLGRAGYKTHAISFRTDALGFYSRYTVTHAVSPAYSNKKFLGWFKSYVNTHKIKAIIPSDGLLLALQPVLQEYLHLIVLRCDEDNIYTAFSKYDYLKSLYGASASSGVPLHLPATLFLDNDNNKPEKTDLDLLTFPCFLKADACQGKTTKESLVLEIDTKQNLQQYIDEHLVKYDKLILQGFAAGIDVGVYFLLWEGEVIAEFMNKSIHSVPHTGGFYSLRESWMHKAIRDDALLKLRHIGWEGAAMMEYRWDPDTDEFYFIELNARFWGSLHHALFAGIDFPVLLMDVFQNKPPQPVTDFPVGLRCRYTFPFEIYHVISRIKAPQLSFSQKARTFCEFFLLFLNYRIYSDLWFPNDKKLYLKSAVRTVKELLK